MRDSNKTFREWMEILHLVLDVKKANSIKEITRLSIQTRYETVYHMVRKIQMNLAELNRLKVKGGRTSILLPEIENVNSDLPKELELFVNKDNNKKLDEIRIVINENIEEIEINIKHHMALHKFYSYPKLFRKRASNFKETYPEIDKDWSESWMRKIKENLIKVIRGVHHNVSLFHYQGELDEYCYKYNYRKAEVSKFFLFFEDQKLLFGRIADTQPSSQRKT